MTLGTRQKGLASWKLTTFAICVLACVSSQAERLPIKTYTTADGLAQNAVNQIVRDSRGLLWFCTNEGLSRFDGYTFTNYTTDDGLPHAIVRSFLETRSGVYWVGTYFGVCRFNLMGRQPFTAAHPSLGAERGNQPTI
jgi:ligand-binding sensor domain-containing protein